MRRAIASGVVAASTQPIRLYDCSGDAIQLYSAGFERTILNTRIEKNHMYYAGSIGRMENAVDVKNADGLVIFGNVMHGFPDNKVLVFQKGPANVVVECNVMYDGFTGVEFRAEDGGTVENVTFARNLMHDYSEYALKFDGTVGATVHNNTFVDIGSDGLRIEGLGLDGGTVRNNAWLRTGNIDAGSFNASHNAFFQTGSVGPSSASDVLGDPLIDANYELGAGSPLIDAGTDVGMRFAGAAPDIGWHEVGLDDACDIAPVGPGGAGGGGAGGGLMLSWNDRWSVADVSVPVPPARTEERETVETARWQRTFTCDIATSEAGRIWDAWAAEHDLRTMETAGPHDLGLSRIYVTNDVSICINFCRMPGQPALVLVHVERPDDLPRTRIEAGVLVAHGLAIPLPPDAEPGAHDDLTDVGGEDCHEVRARAFDLEAMLALYLPWASAAGLVLDDRVEVSGLCSLCFRRPEGGQVTLCFAQGERGAADLRFAFRSVADED